MASANRRPTWRRLALGAFTTGVIVVAILLLLPSELLPETDIWDKLEHAGVFAGLTAIGLLAFPDGGGRWRLAFGLIAFGSTCEVLQIFIPGREAAVGDAVANALGVLSAVGLSSLLRRGMELGTTTLRRETKWPRREGGATESSPQLAADFSLDGRPRVTPSDRERYG
jgi:VanZ family protein